MLIKYLKNNWKLEDGKRNIKNEDNINDSAQLSTTTLSQVDSVSCSDSSDDDSNSQSNINNKKIEHKKKAKVSTCYSLSKVIEFNGTFASIKKDVYFPIY